MNKDIKEQLDILQDVKANIKQSIIGRKQEVPDDNFSTLIESCIAIDGDDFSQYATNKDMNASIARKDDNALVYSKDTNTLGGLYKHNGTTYSAVPTSFTVNKNLVYGGNYIGSTGIETGTMDNFTPNSQAELHTYLDILNNIDENGVNLVYDCCKSMGFARLSNYGFTSKSYTTPNAMPSKYILTDNIEQVSFRENSGLVTLVLENSETSKLNSLGELAQDCKNLTSVDFTGLNTSKVTTMYNMFSGCLSLKNVDLSMLDTSSVTSMNSMFSYCSSLNSVNMSNLDLSKVTNMWGIFSHVPNMTINFGDGWNTESLTNISSMFNNSDMVNIDLSKIKTHNVTRMDQLCSFCSELESITLGDEWDTSSVTSMDWMFNRCGKLKTIDNTNWNTSNVTNMSSMFGCCYLLEGVDVSNWNTSNVTNMSNLFEECITLKTIDVSNWNTSNVTNMSSMFMSQREVGMGVEVLDVSNWNVDKVTNMECMFRGCNDVQNFDISNWNLKSVTNMKEMFAMYNGNGSITEECLRNILKALPTATSLAESNRTISYLGLNSYADLIQTLPEWEACVEAGWTIS